jgi:sensor histidine kinase regulating citrate/malate metabolism
MDNYLEVKDNGPGIHPWVLMEAVTTFGISAKSKTKSEFNFTEHGISLKVNSLRLA